MKKIFFIYTLLISATLSAETIRGHVSDSKGDPMPFVTISVLSKDSALITGAITDDQGKYEIEISNLQSPISNLLIALLLELLYPFYLLLSLLGGLFRQKKW